jgi:acyl-CoA synthetase (AMP-forming)/AMP-acid ligase II
VHAAFQPARLFIMYGCTEAAPRLSYVPPDLLPEKWGSIGRAVPGVELSLVDEDGRAVPLGDTGEIAARGPNIMVGYWRDPVGTAEVLRDGRYLTGDLARADADGCLFIVGRKREILKVGGHRVSPLEIEESLYGFPGVVEAAVVGVEDPVLGEAAMAFVVGAAGQTLEAEEILRFLKERLPAFKVPRSVRQLEALPKNQAGKVQKAALRGLVA